MVEAKRKSFLLVHMLIFFNLLLALAAFMKDMVLASYFGTSQIADLINLAFFLPDTLGNNLIGAAIAVSSIPVLTRLSMNPDHTTFQITAQKLAVYLGFGTLIILAVLLPLFQPLIQLIYPEGSGQASTKAVRYFMALAPIITLAPLWLLGASILQSKQQFIIPALAPILYNLVLLASLIWCTLQGVPEHVGADVFSFANTIGILLCLLLTWGYMASQQEWKWQLHQLNWNFDGEIRQVVWTFAAYALILSSTQLGLFAERVFAAKLQTGTIAALSYAYRLSQFPIWVFIAAINTFILPAISLHLERNDLKALKQDLMRSLLLVIGSSGITAAVLAIFSEPLLSILFLRDSFTAESVNITSNILKGYAVSIIGQSLYVFCTRYYVAKNAMKAPLVIGLLAGLINLGMLFLLVPKLDEVGIGYSAAISSTFGGGILLVHFIKTLFYEAKKGGETLE